MTSNNLWAGAPRWAKYAAKDRDGAVYFYSFQPIAEAALCGGMWVHQIGGPESQHKRSLDGVTIPGDWKKSLRRRPTPRRAEPRMVKAWAFSCYEPVSPYRTEAGPPFIVLWSGNRRGAYKNRDGWVKHHYRYVVGPIVRVAVPAPHPTKPRSRK